MDVVIKNPYERILEECKMFYPWLIERMVTWWPSGRGDICIRQRDGSIIEYCGRNQTIRDITFICRNDNLYADEEKWKKEFGRNLDRLMWDNFISQATLAERCGITQASISRYRNGLLMPSLWTAVKLARALNCSLSELVYFDE